MKFKNGKFYHKGKEIILDDEEKEIEEAFEKGELISETPEEFAKTKAMLQKAAKRQLAAQKSKSITLRLKQEDLVQVKAKAAEQHIPYQTLISLLIHQYVMGERKIIL